MESHIKIDPRRLLDLLAIARSGSFSSAAEASHVSQPALSQSIALLERELGQRTLERGRQGAKLTKFGEALVFHAEALEGLLARAREDVHLHSLGLEGNLAIGITPVTAVDFVPRALKRLLEQAPHASIRVIEGLDREIIEMLRTRLIDLVISRIGIGPDYPDIEEQRLFLADWKLIMRRGHRLDTGAALRLADLADEQWVLPAGGSAFREQMELVLAAAGVKWPARGVSTNSILAIKSMVMNSDGISIMAGRLVAIEAEAGYLRAVPLMDVGARRPVGLMWRKDDSLSPLSQRFVNIVHSLSREEDAAVPKA
jgi:LysR family transcriptional regulator, regulator of abg operon